MPQDKRRSISYRSFVTCDDPKGVECGAIRKSKINNSQKKEQNINKVEADRKQRNQNTPVAVAVGIKEEREKKEMGVRGITRAELENPVSFQLLEVSKEAERLNHVISSWSNSNEKLLKKKQHNIVAKDLLRGALDLQESLVMLGKLQEASSNLLGLSRKQKQKQDEGSFDGMVSGVRGFPRPMIHVDEYPRKSVDEMRNVVRDSLLRQNVITNPIFEEHYDQRKMASPDMLPSTSSSTQSSMVYSSNFVPSDSSISSSTASHRKKGKDSNLIVKLMGLESLPSSPRKHVEREKVLNLAKPMYDFDSPRAKRSQLGGHELGMKQKSVEEIFDNLKFKGLLRNTSVNCLTIDSLDSQVFSSEYCWVDGKPPIVVMKPLRYPCLDLDKPLKPKVWGEGVIKQRYSSRYAQETVRNEVVNFSEKNEIARGVDCQDKARSVKKVASAKVKGSDSLQPKPQKKQTEVKKASEVDKVTPTRRKGEEKKYAKSYNQLSSRDQENFSTAKVKRQTDGRPISNNQTSQQKITSTSMLDQRKQGTSERKKNRQLPLVLEEKRICKGEIKESKAFDIVDIDSMDDNNPLFQAANSITGHNSDTESCQIQIRDYDIDNQIKLLDTPERILYLPNDKNLSHHDNHSYTEITSVSTSEYCDVDQVGETQSPLHEVTLITTHENGVAVHHDANQEGTRRGTRSPDNGVKLTDNETLRQCLSPRMKLKALLLSNSLFVNHVEEFFNIQVNTNSAPCMIDDNVQDLENAQLLIDCANELLEFKSAQCLQACLPLPRPYVTRSLSYFSLDRLLEEVCNEIKDLRLYLRPESDEFPSDNLYDLLDRDLMVKSGTWEVGWRSMFTIDEVEQVIGEVDKFILGKLIEEVISDFML